MNRPPSSPTLLLSRHSRRREIVALLGVVAFAASSAAAAQDPEKRPRRIGFLGNSTAALEANLVGAFRDGLRELGYVEGRNVAIEYRWAEGQYERLAPLDRRAAQRRRWR